MATGEASREEGACSPREQNETAYHSFVLDVLRTVEIVHDHLKGNESTKMSHAKIRRREGCDDFVLCFQSRNRSELNSEDFPMA